MSLEGVPKDVQSASSKGEYVGLPPRPFLYTLDQIADLLSVSLDQLERRFLHYDGRSTGFKSPHFMLAHNIEHPSQEPEWRVAESELVRWMKKKGFRVYARTGFR